MMVSKNNRKGGKNNMVTATELKMQIMKLKKERAKKTAQLNAIRKEKMEMAKLKAELKALKRNPSVEAFKKQAKKKGYAFFKELDKRIAKTKF